MLAGRRIWLLALSAAIHAAMMALVIAALSREVPLPPLFVDLAALGGAGGDADGAMGGALSPGSARPPASPRAANSPAFAPPPGVGRGNPGASPGPVPLDAQAAQRGASAGGEVQNRATPEASLEVTLVEEQVAASRVVVAGLGGTTPAHSGAAPERAAGDPGRPLRAVSPGHAGAGADPTEAGRGPSGGDSSGSAGGDGGAGPGSPASPGRAAAASSGPGSGARGGSADGRGLVASVGRDAPVPAEYGPYLAAFRRRVEEGIRYPLAARRRGLTGTVELEVLIDRGGTVRSVDVVAPSPHGALDEAAVEAVRAVSAEPFPPGVAPRSLRVRLPLVFDLR